MNLKSIFIHKSYGKTGYHGTMTFETDKETKIELKFDSEFGQQIMVLVADQLVGEAKKLAEELTSDCIFEKEKL